MTPLRRLLSATSYLKLSLQITYDQKNYFKNMTSHNLEAEAVRTKKDAFLKTYNKILYLKEGDRSSVSNLSVAGRVSTEVTFWHSAEYGSDFRLNSGEIPRNSAEFRRN